MRRAARLAGLALLVAYATGAAADAPDTSPRPQTRPAAGDAAVGPAVSATDGPRAGARPGAAGALASVPSRSPGPEDRPAAPDRVSAPGSVCRDPDIIGTALAPIQGRLKGCAIPAPVQVRSVRGVVLSRPATIDCATARALGRWLERGVEPVFAETGGGVAGLRVAADYTCRTRNNRPGGKISEHGRGRAIDISALKLADGTEIDVLTGWEDDRYAPLLQQVHRAACGPFGTVLGPEADRYHQDHFHFDTARNRSRAYCR